jgi:hypothetical protein
MIRPPTVTPVRKAKPSPARPTPSQETPAAAFPPLIVRPPATAVRPARGAQKAPSANSSQAFTTPLWLDHASDLPPIPPPCAGGPASSAPPLLYDQRPSRFHRSMVQGNQTSLCRNELECLGLQLHPRRQPRRTRVCGFKPLGFGTRHHSPEKRGNLAIKRHGPAMERPRPAQKSSQRPEPKTKQRFKTKITPGWRGSARLDFNRLFKFMIEPLRTNHQGWGSPAVIRLHRVAWNCK